MHKYALYACFPSFLLLRPIFPIIVFHVCRVTAPGIFSGNSMILTGRLEWSPNYGKDPALNFVSKSLPHIAAVTSHFVLAGSFRTRWTTHASSLLSRQTGDDSVPPFYVGTYLIRFFFLSVIFLISLNRCGVRASSSVINSPIRTIGYH